MWQLDETTATLAAPQCELVIDATEGGVQIRTESDQPLALLWESPTLGQLPLEEIYVRGNDLIARYQATDSFPFDTELCWSRCAVTLDRGPLLAVSLVVSLHTEQLDTHPEWVVTSTLPGSSLKSLVSSSLSSALPPSASLPLTEGQLFWGAITDPFQLVEFAPQPNPPVGECQPTSSGHCIIQRRLFAHFLEKGVLLRSRLFAALLPDDHLEADALRLCQALQRLPLPLTA